MNKKSDENEIAESKGVSKTPSLEFLTSFICP